MNLVKTLGINSGSKEDLRRLRMKEAKVIPKFKVGDVLERRHEQEDYRVFDRVSEVRANVSWDKRGNPIIDVQHRFPSHGAWYKESELTLVKEG